MHILVLEVLQNVLHGRGTPHSNRGGVQCSLETHCRNKILTGVATLIIGANFIARKAEASVCPKGYAQIEAPTGKQFTFAGQSHGVVQFVDVSKL